MVVREYGSEFSKIMGLPHIGDKGYFPYKALNRKYYNYIGPNLPAEFYLPDSMKHEDRTKFLDCYASLGDGYIFDFKTELVTYSVQDVDILQEGRLKFRNLIMDYAGVDPFITCTFASLTKLIWRFKFMPGETVGAFPKDEYTPRKNSSYKSIG